MADKLRSIGSRYTWTNKQEAGARIFSMLDRVFKNEAWMDMFPHSEVLTNWDLISDHYFCLIKSTVTVLLGVKPFRFYNMWIEHKDFRSTVLNNWFQPLQAHGLSCIMRKLDKLKYVLRKFNKEAIGDVTINYSVAKEQFQQAQIALQQNPHSETLKDSVRTTGPDGFGAGFYKFLWKDIGDEISGAILGFFDKGKLPSEINNTTLSLIPKVENPSKAVDFRPISCCNTLYKCISKMIYDLIKGYNRRNISPRCVLKIYLSKAYNTIDWLFLENLLKALCFPSRFIHWIMVCLRGTTYSLMLNGRIQGKFIGRKGLRQWDPISPLLFVLVMKYLTRLLIQASHHKDFRFHPMSKNLNLVSLYFADDLVLFCKGNVRSVQILQDGFSQFSGASGLSMNLAKSHVYFGGLTVETKKDILDCLNIEEGSFPLKYLGIPLRPTKWKDGDCGIIIKKIHLRLHSWASCHLSFAGRAQLIYSILLGIRSYWMSIFLLPQSVTLEIDRLCRNFLWGSKGNRSKLHFIAWDHVCLSKSLGGIGFKEGLKWNKVVLAKYVWALSSKQDLIWVKWVNKIYLKGMNFWEYNLMADVSWYWRKLVHLRSFLTRCTLEDVASGRKIQLNNLYMLLLHQSKVRFAKVHILHKIANWLGISIWLSKFCEWIAWMDGRPKAISSNRVLFLIKASLKATLLGIARKKLGILEKTFLDSMNQL
ncbi:uncharacterized protein LOC133785636 [Humulus lupulus]|uniref:uncharacterized protein LOC133785636 n=1 Tax=Humulus lupulus TaxID=3486 RepID=UPI002B4110B6|nr:uncharacterized protein LOC133785636 [Humulus lupulus]